MATHHEFPKTTVSEFLLATLGGLATPLLVFFLIFKLISGIQAKQINDNSGSGTTTAAANVAPVADVAVGAVAAKGAKSGEDVFKAVCSACHGTGALGSPKVGDDAAWGPRIGKGLDTLLNHALNGFNAMPAKGGMATLSDDEVKAAVIYMANKSGGKFEEPKAAAAETAPADASAEKTGADAAVATATEAAATSEPAPAPAEAK